MIVKQVCQRIVGSNFQVLTDSILQEMILDAPEAR